MRRNAVRIAALALTSLALAARSATAQGFGVYEHDACTMARGGTGVASPCNASATFFNPAGMLTPGATHKWNVAVGATSINADFAFADSASGVTTNSTGGGVLVPNVHVTRQMSDKVALGLGIFAPYGLVSEWPSDANFAGRFLGYRSELKSIYIQPTVSYRVNSWLQVGVGLDYIRSTVDLRQRLDLSTQVAGAGITFANLGIPLGTDFADAHLTGGSWSSGANFGILVKPMRRISIGARYLLRAKADIQGDAAFTQVSTGILLPAGSPLQPGVNGLPCLGHSPLDTLRAAAGLPLDQVLECNNIFKTSLGAQHVSTNVALPDQFVIGTAINVTSALMVLFDYQWVNWSAFSKLQLAFAQPALGVRTLWEDYKNTNGYRFGAQYDVSPALTIRAGALYHDGAAPDQTVTPLLPEGARAEQTLGVGFRIRDNMRIDVAYQHITQVDRRGRIVDAPRFSTANNTGLYTGSANLFGASLAWGF